MAAPIKLSKPHVFNCYVCGDKRRVFYGYVNPACGAKEALKTVPCPKCPKPQDNPR